MNYTVLFLSSTLILSACASAIDHQTVNMTLKTPGAENVKCTLESEHHRYIVHSDQTIEVMKSPKDMAAHCVAPGNREKNIVVRREINGWIVANAVNGFIPGVTYDYLSRGGFDYPDILEVSFAGDAVKPHDLPAYMTQDLNNQNHVLPSEQYGLGTIDEGNYVPHVLEKKIMPYTTDFDFGSVDPASGSLVEKSPVPQSVGGTIPKVSYDPTEEDK